MKVLVTGGAGFIGSHLIDRLVRDGHEVTCFDNFSTGRKENIPSDVKVVDADICFGVPDEQFDWIFNLACPASPDWYQKAPIRTAMTNALGAASVLNLALKYNARVFQASTSEVYGDPQMSPQPETYWGNVNPIGPRACYDEGKRFAETLFTDYHRTNQVDIRIGRIFNTYGPRMQPNDGRVVSNFIVQALRNEPLTIYGDGKQTRSLCYVDDTVEGIMTVMQSDEIRPVNIGRDLEMSINDLATVIIDIAKSKSEIEYHPLPEDDPMQRRPDLTRIKGLGWEPQTYLVDGLLKTIEYFRTVL